jgi:hypothetical protein
MSKKKMRTFACFLFATSLVAYGEPKKLYENNFEKEQAGQVPSDFLVLDGAFAVKQEGNNKVLELPGTPLDSFTVQFGPAQKQDVAVSVRINGKSKGRRYPVFGVGINGSAGYRLQVSPAKQMLELYKDQQLKKTTAYHWVSGHWTNLTLQIRKIKDGQWKIEGKAWDETGSAPAEWMVFADESEPPASGRASVFASPFSGERVQFDDFVVSSLQE